MFPIEFFLLKSTPKNYYLTSAILPKIGNAAVIQSSSTDHNMFYRNFLVKSNMYSTTGLDFFTINAFMLFIDPKFFEKQPYTPSNLIVFNKLYVFIHTMKSGYTNLRGRLRQPLTGTNSRSLYLFPKIPALTNYLSSKLLSLYLRHTSRIKYHIHTVIPIFFNKRRANTLSFYRNPVTRFQKYNTRRGLKTVNNLYASTPNKVYFFTKSSKKLFSLKKGYSYTAANDYFFFYFFLKNPFLLKNILIENKSLPALSTKLSLFKPINCNNLIPSNHFNFFFLKKIQNLKVTDSFKAEVIPWYYNNIIRFIEFLSGRKVLFQFYPFMSQEVTKEFIVRYKLWLPRMAYYERKLGHRFFLEEAVHILHIGFFFKDPSIISS